MLIFNCVEFVENTFRFFSKYLILFMVFQNEHHTIFVMRLSREYWDISTKKTDLETGTA